jgi:enterochelin esterase-like enzyme
MTCIVPDNVNLKLCSIKLAIFIALVTAAPLSAQHELVNVTRPAESVTMPKGTVHHHVYTTRVAINLPGHREDFYVYTPPGYDPGSSAQYPVLYLLHGYSQHAVAWLKPGGVAKTLDSLITEGKAHPMIVVMPHCYGNYRFLLGGEENWAIPVLIDQNVNLFSRMLLTEIIPQVESAYKVSNKREDQAIAGLSMGGREAIVIGLENPHKFAWVGSFSAAFPTLERSPIVTANPKTSNLHLLWIACGVSDQYVFKGNMRLVAQLAQEGFPVTTVVTHGIHEWPVWRSDFKQFAPLLFQSK